MPRGGVRHGAGRPKGSKNKRKPEIRERLDELDCDPITGLARIGRQAESEGNLDLAANCYKSLAPYYAPKLAAVPIERQIDAQGPCIHVVTAISRTPGEPKIDAKESAP